MALLIEKLEKFSRREFKNFHQFMVFSGEVLSAIIDACRRPYNIRYREVLYYFEQCGVKSLPIVIVICFLLGIILGFQGILQLEKLGTQIFVVDLVGWSVLKELGPCMVALIATGRAGSAFAAEIGTMIADEEVNALSTMGISIARFLVIPKMLALVIALPLLTCFGDLAALTGGLVIGVSVGHIPVSAYISRTMEVLPPEAFLFGVSKSIVFAIIIAVIGCFKGLQSTMDAQGVGRSATSAVVNSIFVVIVADAIITIIDSF